MCWVCLAEDSPLPIQTCCNTVCFISLYFKSTVSDNFLFHSLVRYRHLPTSRKRDLSQKVTVNRSWGSSGKYLGDYKFTVCLGETYHMFLWVQFAARESDTPQRLGRNRFEGDQQEKWKKIKQPILPLRLLTIYVNSYGWLDILSMEKGVEKPGEMIYFYLRSSRR